MNTLARISEVELKAQHAASLFEDSSAMYKYAPALFATSPHPKTSQRYAFTNTYDILLHMHNRGFRVTSVMGGTSKFNKVMVRMRNTNHDARNGVAPELVVLDSHDGSSKLKQFMGFITFACMNGCIAGDILYARSYRHLDQDLMAQVMLDLGEIDLYTVQLNQRIDAMRNHKTTIAERIVLADTAINQRFGHENENIDRVAMRRLMLHVRRKEDTETDMFTTMNVIQENVVRGGLAYTNSNHRVQRMRSIGNVDRNLHINQSLWIEAERLMTRALEGANVPSRLLLEKL